VKRPAISSKSKKSSSQRLSFGPGEGESNTEVFTPKKSNLSRLAIEKNAERKALRASLSSDQLPFRAGASEDRPTYSKDYLAELKSSTPSTPKELPSLPASDDEETGQALDVTSKFGPLTKLSTTISSAIPTEAEIREKKERRARLAKEQDYLSLDADDASEEEIDERTGRLTLHEKQKYPETRLVPDDEDIAEGFDAYVEDGKISLGRKAEREAERKRRAEMADMIASAEGVGSDVDASEDSEAERNAAYEAAQTRAGTYGTSRDRAAEEQRPRTPPRITPLPDLGAVVEKLRTRLQGLEEARAARVRKMEELRAEKREMKEREVWIQAQLRETGEKYERLRFEAGLGAVNGIDGAGEGGRLVVNRGLESLGTSLGTTPVGALSDASDA